MEEAKTAKERMQQPQKKAIPITEVPEAGLAEVGPTGETIQALKEPVPPEKPPSVKQPLDEPIGDRPVATTTSSSTTETTTSLAKKVEEVEEYDMWIKDLRERMMHYDDDEDHPPIDPDRDPPLVYRSEFIDDGSWSEEDFNYRAGGPLQPPNLRSLPPAPPRARFMDQILQAFMPFCLTVGQSEDDAVRVTQILGQSTETFLNYTNYTTGQLYSWNLPQLRMMQLLSGSMGSRLLFLARHQGSGRLAVLHAVPREAPPRAVTQERHVWRLTSRHRHVLSLEAYFETRRYYCLLGEWANRGSLISLLQHHGPLREPRAVKLTAQIASALRYIHDLGITYRNMSSPNILLSKRGRARISDFSHSTFGKTAHGIVGQDRYCAPEMLRGIAYDSSSDWWSLGVVMYEMVTGRTPVDVFLEKQGSYPAKDPNVIADAIIFGDIYLPTCLEPATKSFLSEVLQKNPKERLGSSYFPDFKSHAIFSKIDWNKLERNAHSASSLLRLPSAP